jgi:hypothetical protein
MEIKEIADKFQENGNNFAFQFTHLRELKSGSQTRSLGKYLLFP